MHFALIALVALGPCLFIVNPAASAEDVRELSRVAEQDLKWFQLVGASHVAHDGHTFSRSRVVLKRSVLEQIVTVDHSVYKYGYEVGGTPDLGPVIDLSEAGPSRHFPGAVYPSVSPWISVRRATQPIQNLEPSVDQPNWKRQNGGAKSWRTRRPLQEEELVLAVGRRRVFGSDTSELMRVQRFFWQRSMNKQISVSLMPADADGAFRGLRVSHNGTVAEFRLSELMRGEIVGFRADQSTLWITTTARFMYAVKLTVNDGALTFEPGLGSTDAAAMLKVEVGMRPAAILEKVTDGTCDATLNQR